MWLVSADSRIVMLQTLQEATRGLDPRLSHGLYLSSASQRSLKRQPPGTKSSISHQNAQVTVTQTLAGRAHRRSGAVLCQSEAILFF